MSGATWKLSHKPARRREKACREVDLKGARGLAFIARDISPEGLQPRNQAPCFPAATVASQLTQVLGNVPAGQTLRHCNSYLALRLLIVEGVAVVSPIASRANRQSTLVLYFAPAKAP